jgi:hypothetical protein
MLCYTDTAGKPKVADLSLLFLIGPARPLVSLMPAVLACPFWPLQPSIWGAGNQPERLKEYAS